jgi:hypothetical protein
MSDDTKKPDETKPTTLKEAIPSAVQPLYDAEGTGTADVVDALNRSSSTVSDQGDEETLDATLAAEVSAPKLAEYKSVTYNPDKARDEARARITYWLLGLLTLLVIGSFVSVFNLDKNPTFENIKALLEVILGPVIALVSAATGFYFGANTVGKEGK